MTPDFLSSFRLDLTPLSPIHVGSGEDLDPTRYVLDAGTLYEFPAAALARALDEADRKRLLALADNTVGTRALAGIQKLFGERRNVLVAHSSRAVRAATGVQRLYEDRIGVVAQSETGAVNRLEIERLCSHPGTSAPILPGSSLKGAIRTALLDRENRGQALGPREKSPKLQQRLFRYRDFSTDPMRLVHVADAMCSSACEAEDGVSSDTAVMFAVNRKKRRIVGKDGGEVRSQAERKGLYQTLEVVPALRWRAFQGGLTLHRPGPADDRRLPTVELRWRAADIASACNRFYRPILEREMTAMRERGLLDRRWDAAVQALMEGGLTEILGADRAFLLRVGRHCGAESVTLEGVRNIRIMTPRNQEDREEDEATTWWLAADRVDAASGLLPFGWVLVEWTEADAAVPPRPALAGVIDAFHAASGEPEWRAGAVRHLAEVRQEQALAAARRAEAERRRQEREEAERRRVEERAAMTDEERALDDLQALFARSKQTGASPQMQGGELAHRTMQLLHAAKEWPDRPRLQAADLLEEIYRAIGFPKGKKGRERRQRISDLREGR